MADLNNTSYSPYARQRLFRLLTDLVNDKKDMNWSSMAQAIYDWRGVHFDRQNFYRLKKGTLSNANIEFIVQWIEAKFDQDIRERLKPQAIFDEVGKASRDYYFHIPKDNVVEEWDEQILDEFSGVYLCEPRDDPASYLPQTIIRQWCKNKDSFAHLAEHMSPGGYLGKRSMLILQRTPGSYFYAAEFPLSQLFPSAYRKESDRMIYEGVGYVSSNSIHVQLRECLSRVPKSHAILIKLKTPKEQYQPHNLSLHIPLTVSNIKEEWQKLSKQDVKAMESEYQLSIQSDYFLIGPAQISQTPLPLLFNRIRLSYSQDYIYNKKPANFLRDADTHLLLPELVQAQELEKVVTNPLSIGELV